MAGNGNTETLRFVKMIRNANGPSRKALAKGQVYSVGEDEELSAKDATMLVQIKKAVPATEAEYKESKSARKSAKGDK